MLGPLIRVLVVGLVLLTAVSVMTVGFLDRDPPRLESATFLPEPRPLPDFSLTSHRGGVFSPRDLENRYSLVFFGFTNCPDVCPLTLQILADVRSALTARSLEPPQVVFVSVDPGRDDPVQIARYIGYFDETMTGVVGAAEKVKPLLDHFGVGVHVASPQPGQEYTVTHSSAVFLVSPRAEYVAVFSSPKNAEQVARDYLIIRRAVEAS